MHKGNRPFAMLLIFTIFNLPPTTQSVNTCIRYVPTFFSEHLKLVFWQFLIAGIWIYNQTQSQTIKSPTSFPGSFPRRFPTCWGNDPGCGWSHVYDQNYPFREGRPLQSLHVFLSIERDGCCALQQILLCHPTRSEFLFIIYFIYYLFDLLSPRFWETRDQLDLACWVCTSRVSDLCFCTGLD